MKSFLRHISPKRAVQDFTGHWQAPTPHRWQILGLSMAITFAMGMFLIPKSQRIPPARPDITYISTFDETRGEAEIIASNCVNQRFKDELQARMDARAELRKEMGRALGRATFVDVDAMEAEIAAEEARAAAAAPASDEPTPEELALTVEEYCARAVG